MHVPTTSAWEGTYCVLGANAGLGLRKVLAQHEGDPGCPHMQHMLKIGIEGWVGVHWMKMGSR